MQSTRPTLLVGFCLIWHPIVEVACKQTITYNIIACRIMDGGGWHFYSVGCRSQRYTALNGCVKENELAQNLTIIQHQGLGLVPVSFTSQSIDSGDPGGSLGSLRISTTESGCGLVKSRCVLGNIDENIPHPCLLSNLLWHSEWTSAIAECLFLHAVMHQVLPFPISYAWCINIFLF